MKTTIDAAGRIVVPKALRERLSLAPGSEIELEAVADGVFLRPAATGPTLVLEDGVVSGSPAAAGSIQSAAAFERSLATLRAAGRVRLDDVEAAALAVAVDGLVAESVELFGSRADAAGRGGDIDVLILTSAPRFETSRRVSTRFFMNCEERIDVLVLDPDRLTRAEDAFLRSLRRVRIT